MATRGKIAAPGQPEREAEKVEVDTATEPWSEYKLEDGATLRLKQVVTEVWRLIGQYDPAGNPQYVLKTAGILVVNAPDNLKRKLQ